MHKKKYMDITSAGRSALVPFVPGETYRQRHGRRLREAHAHLPDLNRIASDSGWKIRVLNQGSLFEVMAGPHRYEWWPATAKVVVNKKYERGIHCHDFQQLVTIIERKVR